MDKYLFFTGKANHLDRVLRGDGHSDECLSIKVNAAIKLGYQVIEMGALEKDWQAPLWVAMVKVEDD